ncbi:MAG: phospholipase D-like domain-containing protein [Candidatus Babeliales bacterium]
MKKISMLVAFLLPAVTRSSLYDYTSYANQFCNTRAGTISTTLFVPDDPVKKVLLGLIQNERKAIYSAQFRLTDKDIVLALCDAHRRGVQIKIVVDCSGIEERYEKISLLCKAGIPVHKYKELNSTMHNKFFVFFNNGNQGSLVWTGSANTTRTGLLNNQENVYISNEHAMIARYIKKFDQLWGQTIAIRILAEA